MIRYALFGLCVLLTTTASAQNWASSMFPVKEHDFGTVPRASKHQYEFVIVNTTRSDVHIAGVRTSCGCTTPKVIQRTIKPGEKGAILSIFNTRHFLGQRRATITVTIDRPQYAEVQLQIKGYVRQDVVLNPAVVDFGTVAQGTTAERKIDLAYAGRSDWKLTDFRCPDFLSCRIEPTNRRNGQIHYNLFVGLKENAPLGYLDNQLLLVTNDSRRPQVQLTVEGRVASPLTASPASLVLGDVKPGTKVTRQIIVRAKSPFRIVDIICDNPSVTFAPDTESKNVHLIPVTYTAGNTSGKLVEEIIIRTDLNDGETASVKFFANVVTSLADGGRVVAESRQ